MARREQVGQKLIRVLRVLKGPGLGESAGHAGDRRVASKGECGGRGARQAGEAKVPPSEITVRGPALSQGQWGRGNRVA